MSGISSNLSVNYQQQLTQLGTNVTDIEAALKKLENDNQTVVGAYNNAKAKAQETVDWYNNQNFTDLKGNRLHFDTLKEWDDKCKAGGVIWDGKLQNNGNGFMFPVTQTVLQDLKTAETNYNKVLGPTLEKLKEAQEKLNTIGGGLKESIASLEAMKKLLDSGDIEGATMLLQTTRAKGLEQQLGARISALQDRNAQIKSLNDDMVRLQKEKNDLGKDDTKGRGDKDTAIAAKKGEIDKLNSDSQIDMIGIQGLVNKRNESFDMLTNLLGKFQKTIDGIVGNMR
jgi:DNA repair exonuclease SbcCD ATPase subunit